VYQFNWKPSPEFVSKVRAQHTIIGGYELVAYDLPPDRGTPQIVGWELYGPGPALLDYAAANSFEEAKLAAEQRLIQMHASMKSRRPAAPG
jgi:hypothetical protein